MTRFVRTFVSASLLGLVALPVFAQTGDEGPFRLAPDETEIRASDFIGRAIYVPLYAFGVPYVRTLVWAASFAGLVMVLSVLFT